MCAVTSLNVPSSGKSIVAKSLLSLIVSSHAERFGLMCPSMEILIGGGAYGIEISLKNSSRSPRGRN